MTECRPHRCRGSGRRLFGAAPGLSNLMCSAAPAARHTRTTPNAVLSAEMFRRSVSKTVGSAGIGRPAPLVIQYSPRGMVRVASANFAPGSVLLKATSITKKTLFAAQDILNLKAGAAHDRLHHKNPVFRLKIRVQQVVFDRARLCRVRFRISLNQILAVVKPLVKASVHHHAGHVFVFEIRAARCAAGRSLRRSRGRPAAEWSRRSSDSGPCWPPASAGIAAHPLELVKRTFP